MIALSELGKHPNIVYLEGVTLVPFCLVLEKMDGLLSDCLESADWQVSVKRVDEHYLRSNCCPFIILFVIDFVF